MAAKILVGTASWADKPVIESGRFFPTDVKSPEARLRYYASQFPLVEADTTYYGIPTEQTVRQWAERTPEDFTFDVKAYSLFTEHPSPVQRMAADIRALLPADLAEKRTVYRKDVPKEVVDLSWSTFVDALQPLHAAGKLGVVVFQFPKWVFPNRTMRDYLGEVRERLGHYRGAVEFRNNVWLNAEHEERTFGLLRELDLTYVCVDEPQGFASSTPPVAAATADIAFVRFHGRNAETWEKRTQTSAERFDYSYSPEELREWVPKIRALSEEAEQVHAIMNTNNGDQGPANARALIQALGQ